MTDFKEAVKQHVDVDRQAFPRHDVWAVMLYGSQNYGLNTPDSDVDTKAMLLPPMRDVLLSKSLVSTDVVQPDGALSNVKDFRAMFENYLKGNVNFLETLYTDWYWVNRAYANEFNDLRSMRDELANHQPLRLMHMAAGMARQKYAAFEKPFESKREVLAKYGYDPKQLHHLARLNKFMEDYLATCDFGLCLKPDNAEELLVLKTEPLHYEDAKAFRELLMSKVERLLLVAQDELVDDKEKHMELKERLDDLAVFLLTKRMKYNPN